MTALGLFLSGVCGYLLGCFSTGLIVSGKQKVDIRSLGSKSTGATNVTRVMGLRSGLITFLGDAGKAALSVLIGWWLAGRDGGLLAGFMAIIGHNWPVFYGFRGGKGIACSVAVLILNTPLEGVIACVLAVIVITLTHYVSLGSLTLMLSAALVIPFTRGIWPYGLWSIALFLIAAYRHRSNIKRLINGQESKFTGAKHENI